MASFSESALVKKLGELNPSQQSIQTLSLWLIHHRKHYETIVKVWYKELITAQEKRKITFIYLANDVIQNSKKKGPHYGKEFGSVLVKAFHHMAGLDSMDAKSRSSLERTIKVWDERGVYETKQIVEFKKALGLPIDEPSNTKKRTHEDDDKKTKKTRNDIYSPLEFEKERGRSEIKTDVEEKKETNIKLSPRTPSGDPPEPDEIIKALLELENSASSDVAVREAIANLPPEVTESSLLAKITEKGQAEMLLQNVNAAVQLLSNYNGRLAEELEDRKKVTAMLRDFIHAQLELLSQAKERLEQYQDKLERVHLVRQEVRSHIQNLPDITQLPDVMAPLPSAGDLFSFHA